MTVNMLRVAGAAAIAAAIGLALLSEGCATGSGGGTAGVLRDVFPQTRGVRQAEPRGDYPGVRAVYVARDAGGVVGYAVEAQVVSRSGPFIILVVTDADARVQRAAVLSYLGERGREVRSLSFAAQFEGKGAGDAIHVGKDIDAVTGATLSSRAMAEGVRRVVRLVAEEFSGPQGAPALKGRR